MLTSVRLVATSTCFGPGRASGSRRNSTCSRPVKTMFHDWSGIIILREQAVQRGAGRWIEFGEREAGGAGGEAAGGEEVLEGGGAAVAFDGGAEAVDARLGGLVALPDAEEGFRVDVRQGGDEAVGAEAAGLQAEG